METKTLINIVAAILAVVAALHLLRVILGWKIVVNDFEIPVFVSIIVAVVLAYLSWDMYQAGKGS